MFYMVCVSSHIICTVGMWSSLYDFLLMGFSCHSVWELSRKSSGVFSDQRKFLLCLIRPTCQGSRHRLHFSHFNPSSSHCSSHSPSSSVSPRLSTVHLFARWPPLTLPSHFQIPFGLNFPLGIREKEEQCSEGEHAGINLSIGLCLCVLCDWR